MAGPGMFQSQNLSLQQVLAPQLQQSLLILQAPLLESLPDLEPFFLSLVAADFSDFDDESVVSVGRHDLRVT